MCMTALCCLCGSCGVLCLLLVAVPTGYHLAGMSISPAGRSHTFFANTDVEKVLPLAPSSYPEALQGIIWMDQGGAYGHSDIPLGAPDLALSFGDSAYGAWDPKTRTLALDISGPAWTWINRADGYVVEWLISKIGWFYLFEVGADESLIQVYPSLDLGGLGKYSLPKSLMSFTMERQTAAVGACPPKAGSSRKDIAKCAKWDRVSSGLLSPLLGSYGVLHYYVYQIVDGKGNRVQPYYDAYVKFADSTCSPNEQVAKLLGVDTAKAARCPSSFVGAGAKSLSGASGRSGSKSTEL